VSRGYNNFYGIFFSSIRSSVYCNSDQRLNGFELRTPVTIASANMIIYLVTVVMGHGQTDEFRGRREESNTTASTVIYLNLYSLGNFDLD